jgi:hypothetical protein
MDYITLTDHDTIEGCLQILDLPQAFISEQITTYFPQDPCKIHILVWGISEQQHRDIEGVRDNIFELQRYLQTAQIAHAVAHPLYSINGKLEASHLERLILLFKHFEGINGLRDALLSDLAQTLFKQLTPEKIDVLANCHGVARMIMADNFSRPPIPKHRPHGLRQNFSRTSATAIARHEARVGLPSPCRMVFTTPLPASSKAASTKNLDQPPL